jgi:glucose/mannose transport system permease protein
MRRRRIPLAGRVGLAVFLVASSAFFLAPIYVMVATSLKSMPEIRQGSILSLPTAPSFEAWQDAWSRACIGLTCSGISVGFWNSVMILIPGVFFSVLVGALNGYALSLWRMKGSNAMLFLLIAAGFIPYQVIIFPMVKVMSTVGLYSTLPGIVLIHVIFSLPILTLIFRNHYIHLPAEIFKAARVDGAGYWKMFWHIMLPLSPGVIVVAVIIQVTGIWNDFLLGLIFAGRDFQPMTVQLNNLVGSTHGARQYNVEMAATLLTALPPLIVYLLSGRFFVRGITAGAIKG